MKPSFLYKFRSLSQYSLESLAIGKAWFAAPATLNDPYDGGLPILDSVSTGNEAAILASQMIQAVSEWSGGRIPFDPRQPDFQHAFSRFAQTWVEDMSCRGVYSMSEVHDHLLLWAHYANSHRGFAIRHVLEGVSPDIHIEQVEYVDSIPVLHVRDLLDNFEQNLRVRYVTKGKIWAYEREWRAISAQTDLFHPFPIDQIIFGHRMPAVSREACREILGDSVSYFEAIPRDDSFAVEIKPL